MPRKRMTMTERRERLMSALNRMRGAADQAGYLQGCRAADGAVHDKQEVRERENAAQLRAYNLQAEAIRIFNAATRAAAKEARYGK